MSKKWIFEVTKGKLYDNAPCYYFGATSSQMGSSGHGKTFKEAEEYLLKIKRRENIKESEIEYKGLLKEQFQQLELF